MSGAAWQALVMTAVVAVLAAAVVLTDRRPIATERAALVPGLDARAVTAVELARPGEPTIAIAIHGGVARVTAPSAGAADPIAVRDLLSAIATARVDRWSRGADGWRRAGLATAPLTVRVIHARGDATIALGAPLSATGQRWVGVPPDRVALVPAWVGRALDRRLDELRVRRGFATTAPTGVELHGPGLDLVLAGTALVRRDDGVSVRLAPARRAVLIAALGALVLTRFDDGVRGDPIGTIRVLGGAAPAELAWFGPCPGAADAVQVEATIGVGCVARAALDEVVAAATAAAAPAALSPQPLDGTAALARLAVTRDGRTVEAVRHGATWSLLADGGERAADPAVIDALDRALALPAVVRPVAATDDPRRAARWQITTTDGETQAWQVWRDADRVAIRRGDEPAVLELTADARAAATAAGAGLRDRALVRLDPLRVAAIRATGVAPASLVRGELIGEWLVEAPPRATVTADAIALPDWLGQLRVDRWDDPSALGRVRRTLTFTSDPPPGTGPPTIDTVRIGARRADGGCWVAVDDHAAGALPPAACARLLAPLTR